MLAGMAVDVLPVLLILLVAAMLSLRAAGLDDLPDRSARSALPEDGGPDYNRLIHSSSPYLLQHADNPVDWYQWGEAAFERARAEDKPIFLSVGYSTCHWCHVMAHESFEDASVAALLNERFINIKIDREERPDVDQIYMAYVQASSGRGGWPMSVVMTPDRKPFFGATYFPREQFIEIMTKVADTWADKRADIVAYGERVLAQLAELDQAGAGGTVEPQILERLARQLVPHFDAQHGGWGGAPKFPRPIVFTALLPVAHADHNDVQLANHIRAQVMQTLQAMARGGMYDHLGGGFHRYSVDRFWHVPHFEKMLYDQGQLLVAYSQAWQIEPDALFLHTIRGTADYVLRDLRHGEGGFFSAEDADSQRPDGSGQAEGAFYVWTAAELREALPEDEWQVVVAHYGVQEDGNIPAGSDPHGELDGQNVIFQVADVEATAAQLDLAPEVCTDLLGQARQRLFELRNRRPRPHRDEKILTAWNGLMISGLAWASQVTGRVSYRVAAEAAAAFLEKELYDPDSGVLYRVWTDGRRGKTPGFAADYAYLVQGLLDLVEAGGPPRWLRWARDLQKRLDAEFWDADAGGWFATDGDDPTVILRMKDDYDGAEPTPTSVAAMNVLRLGHWFADPDADERVKQAIASQSGRLDQQPHALPGLAAAADALQRGLQSAVLIGAPDDEVLIAMRDVLRRTYRPRRAVLWWDGESAEQLGDTVRVGPAVDGQATAYICHGQSCLPPVTTVEDFRQQWSTSQD